MCTSESKIRVLYVETGIYPRTELRIAITNLGMQLDTGGIEDLNRPLQVSLAHDVVIVPNYGAYVSDTVYRYCRKIHECPYPLSTIEPNLILVAFQDLPDSVDVDLRLLGARILYRPSIDQIAAELRALRAYRARLRLRGVLIEQSTPSDWNVVGPDATKEMRVTSRRQRNLFRALMAERRSFSVTELSIQVGCDETHIRVLVQRLKVAYDQARIPAGIPVSADSFIESVENGYRLFASVTKKPTTDASWVYPD